MQGIKVVDINSASKKEKRAQIHIKPNLSRRRQSGPAD